MGVVLSHGIFIVVFEGSKWYYSRYSENYFFEPIFDIPVAAQETAGFSTGKTGARERSGGQPN